MDFLTKELFESVARRGRNEFTRLTSPRGLTEYCRRDQEQGFRRRSGNSPGYGKGIFYNSDMSQYRKRSTFCVCIAILAAYFLVALLLNHAQAQEYPRPNIIIPNVDDDDGDGIPDGKAAVVNGAADEDMLQVRVKPGVVLPRETMVTVRIAEPWTRFARASLHDSSHGSFQLIQGAIEVSPDEAMRDGIVIGVDVSDFAAAGRPPALDLKVSFVTRKGQSSAKKRSGALSLHSLSPLP